MSVLGTGRTRLTLATFLGNRRLLFLTRLATFIPHVFVLMIPVLNKESTPTLCPPLPIGGEHSRFRHCITACSGAGISTCCPSRTPFGLRLGPDFLRADEPSPENLRLSTAEFLAPLSLLMPAFSLLYNPPLLPVRLLLVYIAPLPIPYGIPKLRCQV